MHPVIDAIDVNRIFQAPKGDLKVLAELSFTIEKGGTASIVGASGSGKSTLLHILGCLDRPTSGKVMLGGQDTSLLSDHDLAGLRNKSIGFVFQFHHLLPEFTAVENVALPLLVGGLEKNESFARAQELMDQVGLKERCLHRPSELSGGEQQRVAVARALANSPEVILADEPTGNLDSRSGGSVADLLWRMNRERNIALVLVTHNNELAGRADRIMELKDGRLWTK
jgi:lipoprotein releasing system ATP-binding protein